MPDERVVRAIFSVYIHSMVQGHASGEAIHLMNKEYEVNTIAPHGQERFVLALRQEMLDAGDLLAVLMTGFSLGFHGQAICEYYPDSGQVEVYHLAWPLPEITWFRLGEGPTPWTPDQDDPTGEVAFEAFKEMWDLDGLNNKPAPPNPNQ